MSRIILTAISSGSGKTIVTCGLLKALKNRGLYPQAYKCGPDYIDPMFHTRVIGVPSENLDTFFMNEKQIKKLLAGNENKKTDSKEIQVIEGAMGIFDGLGGVSSKGSVYDVACQTSSPILLLVDAKGMGPTMIAVIRGILEQDTEHLIQGIILNQISKGFYDTISPLLEEKTHLSVLGFIPKMQGIHLDSRHLGLKLPGEIIDLEDMVERIAKQIEESVNLDRLLEIAAKAPNFADVAKDAKLNAVNPKQEPVRLAIAKDEVFCFYYEENLRLLQKAGVSLVPFSPIHDQKLPENISGILLGGGYPELRLQELCENISMRESIKKAIESGMPSMAECGGFMYLHDSIQDENAVSYEMVGAISGECYNTGKLCRFGYVDLEIGDYRVKGHEFHYFDSSANGSDAIAVKPVSGKSWKFGYVSENHIWGYPHLYYGSCPKMVYDFVKEMRKYEALHE